MSDTEGSAGTPEVVPPVAAAPAAPTISSVDLDAYIEKALADRFVTVEEFQEATRVAQADNQVTKAEVNKLTTLKKKAESDNPDVDSRTKINTAFVNVIPVEMLPGLLKQEALKWGLALILILFSFFMSYVIAALNIVNP